MEHEGMPHILARPALHIWTVVEPAPDHELPVAVEMGQKQRR